MALSAPVAKPSHPTKVPTKIVGTTFEGRQSHLARVRELGIQVLELVRDPLNPADPDAIAVYAVLRDRDGAETERLQLGYVSNSDRICKTCMKPIEGKEFRYSKIVKCPRCSHLFQFVQRGMVECKGKLKQPDGSSRPCGHVFETDMHKTIVCPSCFGDEFARDGFATELCRAMEDGVRYVCRVLDHTGGDLDARGKRKTLGCNIEISQLEIDKPV